MLSLSAKIEDKARKLGFDAVAFARADLPLEEDHARYLAFIAAGRHGEMTYLAENADVRRGLDEEGLLPGAKTVICVARRYHRSEESERADPPLAHRVARYARGRDYHRFLRKRVQQLARFVRTLGPGVRARSLLDIEPVLERAWARRSGLGFIGKNGLLIVPGQGSFVLLAEVVTTLALEAEAPIGAPMSERCGSCSLCLDACPTQAFAAPFVLEPLKCVAYWTIEAKQPTPPALEAQFGDKLFGCDDCQSVCPFNRGAGTLAAPLKARPFEPHAGWQDLELPALAAMAAHEVHVRFRGNPVIRAAERLPARAKALVGTR